ncbi:helix-turn-helix domain-containing protein [Prescottella equi]|uniref:helix-turn-helix domain-containing protein n=1 Tax=Rhodococcus hoagii TaxID=43767 RepID=UPI001C852BEC|nr:helix-turn-helix transcriptional regulator [Prescottella equi]
MHQSDVLDVNQQFGAMMRHARTELGWSQRRLADALGEAGMKIDPSAITRIETGQREPRLNEAIVIADLLNLKLTELSWSSTAVFGKYQEEMTTGMVQARLALLKALRALDTAVEAVTPQASRKIVAAWGAEDLADVLDQVIDETAADMRRLNGQDASVVAHGKRDTAMKRKMVAAVVDHILITDVGDDGPA